MNEYTFPTLFVIAINYLLIQASSVPSERVFSSSKETDTVKRNRINPVLIEAIQMLKYGLKKAHLDFTQGWVTEEAMNRTWRKQKTFWPRCWEISDDQVEALDFLLDVLADEDDDSPEVIEL